MRVLISRADGGVSIMQIIGSSDIDAEIEKLKPMLPSAYVSHRVVDDSEIPADRAFRNAWKPDLSVDMPKALSIAQENIRQARALKMAALDVEFMRAVEAGDSAKQAQVAAQKQRLRDATSDPRLSQAPNANVLKAAMQAVISEL